MAEGCHEAIERLSLYLDGELAATEMTQVVVHLSECHPCGGRLEFERQLRTVVRARALDQAPEGLLERVRERCRDLGDC